MNERGRFVFAGLMIAVALVAFLLLMRSIQGASVTLAWDANPPEDSVAFYSIHYGTNSGTYPNSLSVTGQTVAVVSNLVAGSWFFAATASNADGLRSDFSTEVSYDAIAQTNALSKLRIITYVQSQLPGDSWKNFTNFTSVVLMKPGVPYRSEVYSEYAKPSTLKLSTFIQSQATNGSWVGSTNFESWTIMNPEATYRTLTFCELVPNP